MPRDRVGAQPPKTKQALQQDVLRSSRSTDRSPGPSSNAETGIVPKKKATFNLRSELHQRLKVAAALRGCEMVEIVEDALRIYLREMEKQNLALLNRLG